MSVLKFITPFPKNDYIPISSNAPPANWKAREIIYSRYFIDSTTGLQFSSSPMSGVVNHNRILDFLQEITRPGANPAYASKPIGTMADATKDTPWDIIIQYPCYVVLELDKSTKCTFATDIPAVSTKSQYGDSNCNLIYVDDNGMPIKTADIPNSSPRIIFFCVTYRNSTVEDVSGRQHFNVHIRSQKTSSGGQISITIDPDIPNTGGDFPFQFPPLDDPEGFPWLPPGDQPSA